MDPALLQQILGAGPLAEQQNSAAQELQDLISRRQAYRAQGSKTGAGALFGGIADIIMGNRESEARAKQQDLAKQMAGIRGQYSQAFLGTHMGPAAPPGMPDNPPRIPLSPEDQSQLATVGELSGDPLMAKAGAGALLRGQQAPKLALETEQARKAMQENQAMESPEAGMATRALLAKFGVQVPEGTPTAVARALLPTAEKGFAATESAAARREAAQQSAELRRVLLNLQGQRFEQTTALRDDQFKAKRMQALTDALNPFIRKGGLANYTQGVNRAQKLDALLVDPATGEPKKLLTPQDMVETAIALQQLVAAGHASQSEVEQLIPRSIGGDAAKLGQYFTGQPMNAGQQKWALRMLHTAHREADTNRGAILQALRQQLPQFGDIREKYPTDYEATLKGAGINPSAFDAQGLPVEGVDMSLGTNANLSEPAPAAASKTAALRKKYGL